MSDRESASPQPDPDARLGDLFENLPEPTRQIPTVDNAAPAPGSRRAAREAANSLGAPTQATPTAQEPPADDDAPTRQSPALSAEPQPNPSPALPAETVGEASAPAASSAPAAAGGLDDLFRHGHGDDEHPGGPKKKRRTGCLVALIVLLALVGGIALGGVWVMNTYGDKINEIMGWGEPKDWEPGMATGEVMVTIHDGDTGKPVSKALFDAGVTKTEDVFYDYIVEENLAVTFYPGIYKLQEKMTAAAALEALENPDNKMENTTAVAEGDTLASILPGIAESLGFTVEDMQAATADPSAYGVSAQSLEGWLFPAVYTFDPGVTPTQVVQRMVDRTRESLSAAGVPEADAQRVLTIASIIQREGRVADFDKVSRVIQNRLDDGMKLQMDSTAQYGKGELHAGSVSTSEDAQYDDNPWNTYVIDGLPVTPISTASDAAINAAMHPADGPWLYFVTVNPSTGETVFSTTNAEHEAAKDKWAQWCRDNGNPENGCAG
ncbi:endolytic transglycosylase MltG [Streptomyces sp. AC495_CC817]|uniref:endolytic transglycosylase MltG n=1 Tax=Streptomyces sp. AC495_CC817 TaxID=2823900 RepID=UPI001C26CAAF|nr:endolytic transglycosylase MltG [Streptomyces sp. AC495_CC817]